MDLITHCFQATGIFCSILDKCPSLCVVLGCWIPGTWTSCPSPDYSEIERNTLTHQCFKCKVDVLQLERTHCDTKCKCQVSALVALSGLWLKASQVQTDLLVLIWL